MRLMAEKARVISEGAGALPLAAALTGKAGTGPDRRHRVRRQHRPEEVRRAHRFGGGQVSRRRPATSGVRWRILALLVVLSFVAYVLKTNMSVAGPAMMHDLGLTEVQFGIILAGSAWGYAIFQFPGGVFGDALGGRRAMTIIVVLWGVTTLLVGLVPAAGVLSPVVVLGDPDGAPVPARRGPGAGLPDHERRSDRRPGFRCPDGPGPTPSPTSASPSVRQSPVRWSPGWCWRSGGARASSCTAPAAFLLAGRLVLVRARPPGGASGRLARRTRADRRGAAGDAPAARIPGDWKLVLRDRQVLLLAASYFCINYVFYFFLNWGFYYLVEIRGFKSLEGGSLSSTWWLTGAAGAAVGGIWCDCLSRRIGLRWGCRWPAIVGGVGCGLAMAAAAMANNPYLAVGPALRRPGVPAADRQRLLGGDDVGFRSPCLGRLRRPQYRWQRRRRHQCAPGPAHGPRLWLDSGNRDRDRVCLPRCYLVVLDRGRPTCRSRHH